MKRLIYIFLLALMAASCQRDFDLEYHDIEPLTVIEATLTADGVRVSLTLTTPMDEPMNRMRQTDAIVTLTDITDGTEVHLTADDEGFFVSTEGGINGHEYRLTVERQGEKYEAETTMLASADILGLQFFWINMPYDQVAVLQGQFADNPAVDDECYWVKIYRNGEIYQWQEIDDRGAFGGVGTFTAMTSRRDTDEEDDSTVLYDGDVMTVEIYTITRRMHNYLEAIGNDSNGPALFSGSRVLGYFMASTPAKASVTFHPDEV
ncbi:MAG: DUF4249 domain-containing protein [Muribaculaceae bacterium]|nr:DUF4249 domain-containing protein [Muribaculaceae bacterium]